MSTAVIGQLRGMSRAIAQMAKPIDRDGTLVLLVDNDPSAKRVSDNLPQMLGVIHQAAGGVCSVIVETRLAEARSAPIVRPDLITEEDFIDPDEVKALPTVSKASLKNELADAFPGSVLLSEEE